MSFEFFNYQNSQSRATNKLFYLSAENVIQFYYAAVSRLINRNTHQSKSSSCCSHSPKKVAGRKSIGWDQFSVQYSLNQRLDDCSCSSGNFWYELLHATKERLDKTKKRHECHEKILSKRQRAHSIKWYATFPTTLLLVVAYVPSLTNNINAQLMTKATYIST